MRLTTFLLTFTLTACNSVPTDKNRIKEKEKPTVDNLTKISLPFSSSCGVSLAVYDKDSIQKIIPDFSDKLRFGGLLKTTENYSALILLDTYADYQIHYLTTVSKVGKIIDKFDLFSAGCSEDEFFWGGAKYTIDTDLKIMQTDTSAKYKRTESGEIIKETIVSSSHRLEFYVDKDGKIKKHGT